MHIDVDLTEGVEGVGFGVRLVAQSFKDPFSAAPKPICFNCFVVWNPGIPESSSFTVFAEGAVKVERAH